MKGETRISEARRQAATLFTSRELAVDFANNYRGQDFIRRVRIMQRDVRAATARLPVWVVVINW